MGSSIGVIDVGRKRTVDRIDRAVLIVVKHSKDVKFRVVVNLMRDASGELHMVSFVVSALADTIVSVQISSVVTIFENHVDDTGDRIRTVNGASSVFQDLDPVNGGQRDWFRIGETLK